MYIKPTNKKRPHGSHPTTDGRTETSVIPLIIRRSAAHAACLKRQFKLIGHTSAVVARRIMYNLPMIARDEGVEDNKEYPS